jgi:hypothetical protein
MKMPPPKPDKQRARDGRFKHHHRAVALDLVARAGRNGASGVQMPGKEEVHTAAHKLSYCRLGPRHNPPAILELDVHGMLAGTAVSTRLRRGEPNAWNIVRVDGVGPASGSIEVQPMHWDRTKFKPTKLERYIKREGGWILER